ncbi:MAG: 16S rRNA (cytosine(1402)-N(4))-methyltransferase RsmH [Patescibacteria group bacterium]
MPGKHIPVLLDEVLQHLQPKAGAHYIDCTVGGGGHAKRILEATAPGGRLLAIDLDSEALKISRERLRRFGNRATFVQGSFANLKQIYDEQFSLHKVYGILLDLGISSIELEGEDRGFSFRVNAALDMRFDSRQELTAATVVNTWPFEKIEKVIREYGQEPLAHEITKNILNARQTHPIIKTKTLVEAILPAFRNKLKTKKEVPWIGGTHPATRTFQALRIAVNGELDSLERVLPQAVDLLVPGGMLCVLTFHSLEDRIVKRFFRELSRDCICPPELPVCRCGHRARVRLVTRRGVAPTREEMERNPRSRSAHLRTVQKL